MRPPVDEAAIRTLARELGRTARVPVRIYLTGGATAVIEGWRAATIDVDLRFEPEAARLRELFDAIAPEMYRYPAIGPAAFREKLNAALE